ncbi:hypothetical protein ESY86_09565 [Subsaximicrobium wynnwilliamsii]|uniref:Uncharacterized protein n=1 Tax=Subsaximicrobium wynnwilliamsii TaxID=291179 RepID=A0A5C6ZKV3_9FLAO|nr:hypothetical protein [Subsaximicrobium wynnwilliamsii]TXD83446.1 hypothetical protein ESY87_09245 [Subsaximicrobium wynnwilliamsii]TXD89279.1 hypothetical protein ESY86_09565 [Subsaximicrobium wynnwilliamsii]TXE03126.1 hypothetical protein ESY88_08955 [Subsaximicrobium wynnwilliamsii]
MLWLKLKAGALQLTLFIAVVVALLLMAFILLVHTHKRFQVQTDFIIETVKNADRGIQYALNNTGVLRDSTYIQCDADYKTLKTYRSYWGVFEKITSVSKIKNNTVEKYALVGGQLSKAQRPSLYLSDERKPLVLVGNTRIEGLAYLPEQAVKSGNIAGHSYYGSQLIYGQTRTAYELPDIDEEMGAHLSALEDQSLSIPEDQFLAIEPGKTYKNSFFRPVQIVYSNQDINLGNLKMTGNIIVQSESKITVAATSVLKDIVLVAPEIEIQNKVKGNFQAIASERIVVGENVALEYPSALVVKENESVKDKIEPAGSEKNAITIGAYASIKGVLLFLGQPKPNNYEVQLGIETNASIIGEVYCNQNIELQGTVLGTVYAKNFIAKQFGSIYQNHIYNGQIIATDLPEEFIGLNLTNTSEKGIVKWLY